MKLTFNLNYFIAFCVLLIIEISIAVFLKDGFIRHTFGDYLATIWLYCFFKSFTTIKPIAIAIVVLLIAFGLEFLQLYNALDHVGLRQNRFIATVFGTSFSIQDLVAYTLGVISIFGIDRLTINNAKK